MLKKPVYKVEVVFESKPEEIQKILCKLIAEKKKR